MFNTLDIKKANTLFVVRQGWLSSQYNLTDNTLTYGSMKYYGLLRRKAVVETANANWVFGCAGLSGRTVIIKDEFGTLVGKAVAGWFSYKVKLTLETGFTAEFYKPSLWRCEYTWAADGCGKILHISNKLLSNQDTINIDNSLAPPAIVPLLIFLGEHLILLKRRREAAH